MDKKTKACVRSVLKTTVIVPAFWTVLHVGRYFTPDILGPDYSLGKRLEAAYNPVATWDTRSYTVIPRIDGNYYTAYKDEYVGNFNSTLSLHLVLALIAWLSKEEEFKRQEAMNKAKLQKTK